MVQFLGKNYDIPNDLEKYMEIYSFFEDMRVSLISMAQQKIKTSEINLLEDDDMLPAFRTSIAKVIGKLCCEGVYDKTIDEYIDSNEGYQQFSAANKLALEQFCKFLREEMIAFKDGWEAAESRASASITGSGVTVFSSSFLTLAAAAAYDYSCAKEQFKMANDQFKLDMSLISKQLEIDTRNKELNYLNNTYIPSIMNAISIFSFSAMDKYLHDLIDADKFDSSTLNYIDYKKSNGILSNLQLSNDIYAILENAFISCPFNERIYQKAAEYGILDVCTIQTANRYCPTNNLSEIIKNQTQICSPDDRFTEWRSNITENISKLSAALNCTIKEATMVISKPLYQEYSSRIEKYKSLSSLRDYKMFKMFIRKSISDKLDDIVYLSDAAIRERISNSVQSFINSDNLNFLIEAGFSFDFPFEFDARKIIEHTVDSLCVTVKTYIQERSEMLEKLDQEKLNYENQIRKKTERLLSLESRLESLNYTSIFKRKEIKSQIEFAKDDLEYYKSNSSYIENLNKYYDYFI